MGRRVSRIVKSATKHERKPQPWVRDRAHLDWIATLACLRCGRRPPCHPAHIRLMTDGATGRKPSDFYVVPLCPKCHTEDQHWRGERTFWAEAMAQGISDPWSVAQRLYRITGDTDRGYAAIAHARPGLPTAWLSPNT